MRPSAPTTGALISVDGVSARAVMHTARRLTTAGRGTRAGISHWDASGIFGELRAKGPVLQKPSARTLLLLYAADLAFRLRWEIRPALAEGRRVVAAPYVDTAVALGYATGVDDAWLQRVFDFAPVPIDRHFVDGVSATATTEEGFLEFACRHLANVETRATRLELLARTKARLKATRHRSRT